MGTPAVGVDRPAERHPRLFRDAIQRRARLHLVKVDADRLRSVEGPNHGVTQAAQLALRACSSLQVVPSHNEHMFADPQDSSTSRPPAYNRTRDQGSSDRSSRAGKSAPTTRGEGERGDVAKPAPVTKAVEEKEAVVVRFAGDSGDGMQLAG